MTDLKTDIANNPTVFGKLLRGELPINKVYEDEKVLAFHSIAPEAPVHIVAIPKQLIEKVGDLTPKDQELMGYLLCKIPEIADKAGVLESGFRLIANSGPDSQSEVPHLHFHILGGEKLGAKIR